MKSVAGSIFLGFLILLVVSANAAFTPSARSAVHSRHSVAFRPSPSPRVQKSVELHTLPLRKIGLFQKPRGIRWFPLQKYSFRKISLRGLIRKIATSLVALLFAASVFFGGHNVFSPEKAHASTEVHNPKIERIVNTSSSDDINSNLNMLVKRTTNGGALKLDEETFYPKMSKQTLSKNNQKAVLNQGVNGKLVTVVAGTIVLGPSAGLVVNYRKKNGGEVNNTPTKLSRSNKDATQVKAFKKPSEVTNVAEKMRDERVEKVQQKKVQEVLNKAKDADQKVVGGASPTKSVTSSSTADRFATSTKDTTPPPTRQQPSTSTSNNGVSQKASSSASPSESTKVSPEAPKASASASSSAPTKVAPPPSPKVSSTPATPKATPAKQVIKKTVEAKLKPTIKASAESKPVAETTEMPLQTKKFVSARTQPKSPSEEQRLKEKYAKIENLEEKAYAILLDLGMIEPSDDDNDDFEGSFQ